MPLSELATTSPELLTRALVQILGHSLRAEEAGKQVRTPAIPERNALNLNAQTNALLLEFRMGSGGSDPAIKPVGRYRVLVVLSLFAERELDQQLVARLRRTGQVAAADRVVVWTTGELSGFATQNLKDSRIDIISVPLPTEKERSAIQNFAYVEGVRHSDLYQLNVLASRLMKRLRKKFHLVLSELAAPTYDSSYGRDNVATQSIMQYEEELLQSVLASRWSTANPGMLAIDVGCGTGRHSFILGKYFQRVLAFDFSAAMIHVAQEQSKVREASNVEFFEYDFEYEDLPDEADVAGSVDFICASFGMGSFIENTTMMIRRFAHWLRPGGLSFISFYNGKSLSLSVTPNWRDSSLATKISAERQSLEVNLSRDMSIEIYCMPYSDAVRNIVGNVLRLKEQHYFPTTMSILPNSLLVNPIAREVFEHADRLLAVDQSAHYGHYVLLVLEKKPSELDGFDRIAEFLKTSDASYEILAHGPVVSLSDVQREIRLPTSKMVKAVVIRITRKRYRLYAVAAVPFQHRVDLGAIARHYEAPDWSVQLATASEIKDVLGFPLGGVAPIALPQGVHGFIHAELRHDAADHYYMGVGDNRKTLRLDAADFRRLTSDYTELTESKDGELSSG